ncbi:hypothetical protein HHI36_001105 [Cryptolaemus montrouzieri]|uniref:Uncharacterized protein n=1 Tax=Cryptolaemus montrouzieri TaxID=559131 RepID=A0ABD2P6U6_9CUCU
MSTLDEALDNEILFDLDATENEIFDNMNDVVNFVNAADGIYLTDPIQIAEEQTHDITIFDQVAEDNIIQENVTVEEISKKKPAQRRN